MDIIKLDEFPNIASGAPFTLVDTRMTNDMSILGIIFELGFLAAGAFVKADISDLEIMFGGKSLLPKISGTTLQYTNSYDGMSNNVSYLTHYFGDPTARTIRGQWLGALDKSAYPDEQLTIKGAIGAAAVTPTMQAYAMVDVDKRSMGIGFGDAEAAIVRALINTTIQPAAAVNRKGYGIGIGSEAGAKLRKIIFDDTLNGVLTSIEMKKNSIIKYDDISVALNDYVGTEFARVPQPNLYMLDRVVDGNQGESETTVDSNGKQWPMQFNLTASGAGTIEVFADVFTAVPLI